MQKKVVALLALITAFNLNAKTLFIGDSHAVGLFGKKFDRLLRSVEADVITHTSCGAIGKWFRTGQKTSCGYFFRDQNGKIESGKNANTPVIDQTIKMFGPDLVVIEMGGNYTNRTDSYSVKDIDELVSFIIENGAKCLWIGTPSSRDNIRTPRLYRLIKEGVKNRCPIFNSSEVTVYPSNPRLDGVHYWGEEGKKQVDHWAQKAFEFYQANQ